MERGDLRMELHGAKELTARLRGLDKKVRRSIAGKALRAGAKIMVKALRSAAPVRKTGKAAGRGAGKKSLGTKVKTYRNSGITVAISGERKTGEWVPHFHLIEYGTQERYRTGQRQTARLGKPVGAFGLFGSLVRKAQQRERLAAGIGMGATKRSLRESSGIDAKHAAQVMAAIRTGQRTGRVTPRPFFKKAFMSAVGAVQAKQMEVLKTGIEAAWVA
jgi:hypothetical protein